ncbi:group I intron-associated PD-(D/E)XK endonuclease [Halobium salinum]|uniref:Group I intron-associated PD-(D/E)XK endonuclease n=1 Tax=Halobium salinum TaxID=1364940 RepID=A0ABD5PC77_9EURY|nr:group I intron-associated PD-(D/E)XK endonuclease [Halobium salinum]
MSTKQRGDETESRLLAELISRGYSVSVPFGDNDRYDLVVDAGDSLYRVQCKTGWVEEEARIRFKTGSKTTKDGVPVTTDYGDDIDSFAVYCAETTTCYWIPADEAGKKSTYLRVVEAAIDHPSVKYARDYRFARNLPELVR